MRQYFHIDIFHALSLLENFYHNVSPFMVLENTLTGPDFCHVITQIFNMRKKGLRVHYCFVYLPLLALAIPIIATCVQGSFTDMYYIQERKPCEGRKELAPKMVRLQLILFSKRTSAFLFRIFGGFLDVAP
jgi:hypothetical protein